MIRRAPSLLLVALATAQEPPARPAAEQALERFATLGNLQKAQVLRHVLQRLLAEPDPHLQRILAHDRPLHELPEAPPGRWHRAEDWAPGIAPERRLIDDTDERHAELRRRIPRLELLPDLHKAIRYDWGTGTIVQRGWRLGFDEQYENLVHGYVPGSDAAVADVLAALDRDERQRAVAAELEHWYADLDAQVWAGVTLYEAWYSGKIIDVPDVDSIPIAIRLLGDRSYRSPVPADERRKNLYQRIRDVAAAHRRYRTLREAAAAAYVAAEPAIDPTYAPLVPRFHLLFALHGEKIDAVAEVATRLGDRDRILEHVDDVVTGTEGGFAQREERQRKLAGLAAKVRRTAIDEVLQ